MTKIPRGALHFDGRKSIGSLEANENQRRWDQKHYETVNKKPRHWYDPTRAHLNFEVAKGGQIQPCGTSKPVDERWRERLAELGVTPNPLVNERQGRKKTDDQKLDLLPNQLVEFVISGDHATMNRMAFGDQAVDFAADGTADNSHIKRQPQFENWTLAIYNWMAEKYGEENIVGFDAHLDETTGHIHASIIPVVRRKDKKTGEEKEVVSYKGLFGKNKSEGQDIMIALHTELYERVNCKFGLQRGESVQITGAQHKNKIEMFYQLNDQVEKLEEEIIDLKATINGQEQQLASIRQEITKAEEDLNKNRITRDEYLKLVFDLKERESVLTKKIESRREKLMNCESDMEAMRKQTSMIKAQYDKAIRTQETLMNSISKNTTNIAKGAAYDEVMDGFYKLFATIPRPSDKVIESIGNPLLSDFFSGDLQNVMTTAGKMMLVAIDGATTVTPSSGGGGGSNDLPKKKDDEDWWKYGRNAVGHAHSHRKSKIASGRGYHH